MREELWTLVTEQSGGNIIEKKDKFMKPIQTKSLINY